MQPGFDRSDFRLHSPRDFFERQFFVLRQDQYFSLQWRERTHRLADNQRRLTAFNIKWSGDELLVFELLPAMFVAPPFQDQIPRDPQQERPHASAARVKSLG